MKILLLEDDIVLSNEICIFLQTKELEIDTVFDGDFFLKQLNSNTYDIYLLDINVPKINGLEVCKNIRVTDKNTPILMLTAYGEIEDKVEAFHLGADDYLVKPFHLEELFIRINALFRRRQMPKQQDKYINIGNLTINVAQKLVERAKTPIHLTPKEFNLLLILAEAKGRVVSKQIIADILWDYHIETSQNTIEVYINFLRNKIDKDFDKKLIHTKIGFGYYLKEE